MTLKFCYQGCRQTLGSFSSLESEHLHLIFAFFENVVLVNDEHDKPRGMGYGYHFSLQDWVEELYVFDVGYRLATLGHLLVVLLS